MPPSRGRVVAADGTYLVDEPLVLGPEDDGTAVAGLPPEAIGDVLLNVYHKWDVCRPPAAGPPTGASSSRFTMTATSFKHG